MTDSIATAIRRRLTQDQWADEARARFGPDPLDWRVRCTACGHTQSAAELPTGRRLDVAQACFGCGLVAEKAEGDFAAGLWRVKIPGIRRPVDVFPLADELDSPEGHSGPVALVQALAATGTPARATDAPTPPAAPVRAASSLTPPTAYWVAGRGWVHAGDLDPCECHIAPPCVRCESLQVCEHCPTEVFVHADDMDAHLAAIHPEIAESEA